MFSSIRPEMFVQTGVPLLNLLNSHEFIRQSYVAQRDVLAMISRDSLENM